MATQEEIDKIKEWCKKVKEDRGGRIYIMKRNPFQNEIDWMRSKVYIEIDKPKSKANKHSLVYDSTTDALWEYMNGSWRKIDARKRGF